MDKKITIMKDGPYIVCNVPLKEKIITPVDNHYELLDGRELPQKPIYALCRCGKSKNMPFCDGLHIQEHFDGTEVASKADYNSRVVEIIEGEKLDLFDDGRCALARFCHREKGDAWELAENSADEQCKEEAIIAACECPTGRLVAKDKDGKPYEYKYDPVVEIFQDPEQGVSSSIVIKGYVPIYSSCGELYEVRNRVALCRCGKSKDMPFCDAEHIRIDFNDGFDKNK